MSAVRRGPGRRVRGLRRSGGRGQAVAATACVGMPSSVPWQKGRQAGRLAGSQHRQESAGKHRKTAWVLGPLHWDRPGCRDPHPRDSAPCGQHGCRPQRRTAGTAQVIQGQQSSRQCQGWLGGPRSSQGLKAQQPHRWPGVVAGVLVKEKGDHSPQQCAGCLQCQRGQPQGQGHPALPWAGPQGQAPGTMTAGGQGWGGWTGARAV